MGQQESSRQQQIISALGAEPQIDPEREIERRVSFLTDYVDSVPGARGFVLGISGGQDSALAGRLAQLAVERLRGARAAGDAERTVEFVAVRLPYSVQHDADDARLALEFITPDIALSVNIGAATDALVRDLDTELAPIGSSMSDFNRGNVKARMRMVAQYAVAGARDLLVVGTDHAAEAVTGFFTKFGDGAADVLPLAGLTKSQGAQLLQYLGAPERLWRKAPTADLLDAEPGQTDESSLGMSYAEIDAYLSGAAVSAETAAKIEGKYLASEHKRRPPVGPLADWWRKE